MKNIASIVLLIAVAIAVLVNENVYAVTANASVSRTASLAVTIVPTEAVAAGAQWSVDNGPWRNSGVTVSGLSLSTHYVSFKTVSGYITPPSKSESLSLADSIIHIRGTYSPSQDGSLIISLSPSAAVTAGAQWQVDAGAWRNSGQTESGLSAGSHTVSFRQISGYTVPASRSVTIEAGKTTKATGVYEEVEQPHGCMGLKGMFNPSEWIADLFLSLLSLLCLFVAAPRLSQR